MRKNSSYKGILLIAIAMIALVLLVSGCTTQTTTGGSATPTAAPAATVSTTPTSTTGSSSSAGSDTAIGIWQKAFDFDKLNWYTYEDRAKNVDVKVEYKNEPYNGIPARHIKVYVQNGEEMPLTQEAYYDPAAKQFLAGTVYSNGVAQPMDNYDAIKGNDRYFGDVYGINDRKPSTVYPGEKLSAAGGTYDCTQYGFGSFVFYTSPDVPLPLKWQATSGTKWTLKDWG